jgi:hypothetical protein
LGLIGIEVMVIWHGLCLFWNFDSAIRFVNWGMGDWEFVVYGIAEIWIVFAGLDGMMNGELMGRSLGTVGDGVEMMGVEVDLQVWDCEAVLVD